MAAATAAGSNRASPYTTTTTVNGKASRRNQRRILSAISSSPSCPPLILSTHPSHVDIHRLKDLYAACNLAGHRFPTFDREGRVEPVDLNKLRIAVSNSFAVTSVFSRQTDPSSRGLLSGAFLQRMVPLTHWNGELVGFGRAVSDSSLTASIHDVMVIPSLRRLGIGQLIVKRLIRVLTSKDIYDIAAVCDEKERLFFEACGFGDDVLNSTTMMYTRSGFCAPPNTENDQIIIKAG
ncbi:unnamed protein product [Rhodiola kirilowii]